MNDRRLRENRNVPINLSGDQFRALGHDLVDRIADLFDTLPGRPVTTGERPSQIRALLDAERALPEDGVDARALMTRAADLLIEHSLYNGHPRFWGYITAPAAPIGVLGELLASAVNPNLGGWPLSPMSTEIELQTLRWIAELIGYPRDGGGILVSGGNMANFVGFLAARAAAGGADLRRQGMGAADHARLRVYASAETHTWIDKAADLFGLGTDAVRRIPTDDDLRIDTRALREQIAADRRSGERPFMVIGTAGSVSTGAVDPLPELAQICREQGLWFHVDGAYGGFAVAAPEA
ncbi:MAG TPA: aminotransferase class V-fold PLP-dependent enzyme, partial [bacterium]|nr:aminotransferase class V-fold PLP-dependent enzyme [bacterium]